MKKLFSYITICLLFGVFSANAQQTPADDQSGSILIMGATAHLGNGEVIESSVIAFDEGKITLVADMTVVRINRNDYDQVIEATGKHVYPGLIAANTTIGLNEIGAVRATRDDREVGDLNPHIRSIIAYNTDSRVTPTIRSNGVLLAEVVPQGGIVSGTASVVELDAWNWEDAAYHMDNGVHVNWPSTRKWDWNNGNPRSGPDKDYQKNIQKIRNYFMEAIAYSKASPENKNLRFEAMNGVISGDKMIYIHASAARAILDAISFAKEFDLNMVIVGGNESWLVADELKNNNVPVVLGITHRVPGTDDADIDLPYKLPALLYEKGVEFCISHNGYWAVRNLPFQAGQAVSYGLPAEEGIKAMTSSAAKLLGIGDRVGTLEQGKDATLFISKGDIMDMRTSIVERAFIRGKDIDVDNKQKELYRKYTKKYEND
ncbi:MAG: amidohydrolase family protein [Bacteroidota bacterium]